MENEEEADNPGAESDEDLDKQSSTKSTAPKYKSPRYTEKVKCQYCPTTLFRKNYKDHIKTKHPDKDPNNLRPGTVPTLASFLKRKNKDSNNARKRQRSGDSGVGDEEETVTPAVPVTGQTGNKQGTTASGGARYTRGDEDDDDKTEEDAENPAVTGQTGNKHGTTAAGGSGVEDEEDNSDNVEEQVININCPLKYLHQALKQLRNGEYQDTLILDNYPAPAATLQPRTRASQSIEAEMLESNVEIDVLNKLRNLCSALSSKIESETVSQEERDLINTTKVLLNFRSMSMSQNKDGLSPTAFAHQHYPQFQEAVDRLRISSLDAFDKSVIEIQFKRFIKKLWELKFTEDLSDEEMLQRFLSSNEKLYEDVEVIMHILVTAATKSSCESVVESYVRYQSKNCQIINNQFAFF